MKKILGLDLGVSSIGWALVNEAENKDEKIIYHTTWCQSQSSDSR